MSNHFTHLHLHTEYSLLDGAIRISELVDFAKEQSWKAVGISDHGNVFGAVKFFQEAQKAKIKPILGCEMYFTTDVKIKDVDEKYFHLLVIVQNQEGYKNLCKLMAFSYKEGFYFKPRIDYEILKKHSAGLIVTTSCLGGHIPTLLRNNKEQEAIDRASWFLDVFGKERFFVEVQPPDYEKQKASNEKLFGFAEKMGISCVATSDSHFVHKDDHEAHEIMLSIQTHALFSDPARYTFGEFRGHLRTTNDMLAAFPGREDVVFESGKIADSCDFNFTFGKLFFPTFDVPAHHSQESFFRHLCLEGLSTLKNKNLIASSQHTLYDARLHEEIELIITMGFVGYFLVVSDFIAWAKKQHIPVGPGRGSVAGSLIAWALGITNVDPIKYNLLFERFLNPERVSMPDIDIDFCIERREEVIDYVREKYGKECVCQIITFGTMMAKGVIKDVARTLGFPFKDSNALTDLIPDQLKITIDEALKQEARLKEIIDKNPQVKKLIDICKRLEGLTRHASKHAAGVVISPKPLDEMVPLYIPPKTTDLVAQYAMTELESVGFLKMDFLGLKNLTLIDRALKTIASNHGITIDLDTLALDDKKTLELLCRGESNGIFQFESDGIKDVLRKLQPDKFEDLIAVNALYRPGPLGSGMVDDYIERRHGRKKTTYAFPELEPILSETYGVIVYQEQVMKIASAIAGYSLGASDILRRAMGKKKADVMEEQKALFVEGAKKNGFNTTKAGELFDLMAYFAGYGFNKSHSTAYALIAYHTAFLKAHYPAEFMAALVSFETSNPDKMTLYLQEISDMGIITLPPDINHSDIEFCARDGKIVFGLQGIKNVGMTSLQEIITVRKEKPFCDLLDFCCRVDLRTTNKRIIENLIAVGAFDSLPGNRAQKTNELEKIIARAHEKKEALKTGQLSLFAPLKSEQASAAQEELYAFSSAADWSDKEKLEKERELAGFYLSSHPLKTYNHITKWISIPSFSKHQTSLGEMKTLKDVPASGYGLKQSYRVITTKKGDSMAFLNLEDFSGTCEVILFPKVYKNVASALEKETIFIVQGMLDSTSLGKCKIKANSLIAIDELFNTSGIISALEIALPESFDETICAKIKDLCVPGKTAFYFVFNHEGKTMRWNVRRPITLTLDMLNALELLGAKARCLI